MQLVRDHSVTVVFEQLAEPLWTDPGLKSGISMFELISTWKKKASGEWIVEHSAIILACEEKATTTTTTTTTTTFLTQSNTT